MVSKIELYHSLDKYCTPGLEWKNFFFAVIVVLCRSICIALGACPYVLNFDFRHSTTMMALDCSLHPGSLEILSSLS